MGGLVGRAGGTRGWARRATVTIVGVAPVTPLQGELQAQVMAALWRLEQGTVEQVRRALPSRHQSAYTTVQTVLNRLADRGLLERRKAGREIVYRPILDEASYLVRALEHTLSGATGTARTSALAQLLGRLDAAERADVQQIAERVDEIRSRQR